MMRALGYAATYLLLNERGEREVVKEVRKVFPNVRVAVLAQALVVETVNLRDLPRFVVAARDRYPLAVAHLEREEQRHGLHGVVTAVHVVSHKQIVRLRRFASNSEQLNEVVELAMDITAHRHGALDVLHVLLVCQYFASL